MKSHFPNALTSGNLFSGCIAIVLIFRNNLEVAAYFVLLAALFDLLDGFAARKFSPNSAFGKELDSLADVISFGFVPGAIMFKLLQFSGMNMYFSENMMRVIQFFPFIITIFSALRLAKFNIDTRQKDSFIGLPVPANTLFIISLPMILNQFPGKFDHLILNPYFIIVFSILSSFMLVSQVPLFSLKFKNFKVRENIYQYIFLLVVIILVPLILFSAIPLLIIFYILLSIIQNITKIKS